jgi:hypothetical protein
MNTLIRARSLPYQPQLPADVRVCTRCGIHYHYNTTRDTHLTTCRDCRGIH